MGPARRDRAGNAEGRSDYAREHAGTPYAHPRDAADDTRRDAQFHSDRSVDASRLAETWAHVALALAPLRALTNGQPATYDIQIIGATDAATELQDTLRRLKQRGPGRTEPVSGNPRNGRPYRRACAEQRALLPPCWWCGKPIRYDITGPLAGRHPLAFTLDHLIPPLTRWCPPRPCQPPLRAPQVQQRPRQPLLRATPAHPHLTRVHAHLRDAHPESALDGPRPPSSCPSSAAVISSTLRVQRQVHRDMARLRHSVVTQPDPRSHLDEGAGETLPHLLHVSVGGPCDLDMDLITGNPRLRRSLGASGIRLTILDQRAHAVRLGRVDAQPAVHAPGRAEAAIKATCRDVAVDQMRQNMDGPQSPSSNPLHHKGVVSGKNFGR